MPAEGNAEPGGTRFAVSGVTRDASGSPLGGCTVLLYRTPTNAFVDLTVSDGSGNYTFANVTQGDSYFVVAYLPGSPDRSGTTVDTITGTESD